MPTSVPNFNFLTPLVTDIRRGLKIKLGAADLPRRPLAVKFLHVAIVPANACQHTKFQLSSSISFGDMRYEGVPKWKVKAPDFPRRPLADKFLYRTLVRVNTYKCAKFQLQLSTSTGKLAEVVAVGSNSFGNLRRRGRTTIDCCQSRRPNHEPSPGLWSLQTPPSGQICICSHSTCKCLPEYQISTF